MLPDLQTRPPADRPTTMSSRQIATQTGKRHDHVLRDIKAMLAQLYGEDGVEAGLPAEDRHGVLLERLGLGIDSPDLGNGLVDGIRVQRDARGFIAQIHLDYSHTITLIAGYKARVRKAIVDEWQRLTLDPPAAANDDRPPSAAEIRAQFEWGMRLAETLGLEGNQAALSSNALTGRLTGVDVLGTMGIAMLPAPQQTVLLNPTGIGKALGGVTPRNVNLMLIERGLQSGTPGFYEPTEAGRAAGAVMVDVARGNGTGTARQLRWSSSVVELLRDGGAK